MSRKTASRVFLSHSGEEEEDAFVWPPPFPCLRPTANLTHGKTEKHFPSFFTVFGKLKISSTLLHVRETSEAHLFPLFVLHSPLFLLFLLFWCQSWEKREEDAKWDDRKKGHEYSTPFLGDLKSWKCGRDSPTSSASQKVLMCHLLLCQQVNFSLPTLSFFRRGFLPRCLHRKLSPNKRAEKSAGRKFGG